MAATRKARPVQTESRSYRGAGCTRSYVLSGGRGGFFLDIPFYRTSRLIVTYPGKRDQTPVNPSGCSTSPITPPGGCFPDAPVEHGGCPLLMEGNIPDPPANIDCDTVCGEYSGCVDSSTGVEIGFTCDAVLCTSTCQDNLLVDEACTGLQSPSCSTSEIIKLEVEVGCSCCASQICGCEANSQTEQAIFNLNQDQRDTGITPQCDRNGTLCGEISSSACALAPAGAQPSLPLYLLFFGLIVLRRFRRR